MKKIVFFVLIFLFLSGCSTEKNNDCGILPKEINYKIVLNNELYILTEHGLIEKGYFVDFEKWRGNMYMPALDNANKTIYFASDLSINPSILEGLYKIDLKYPLLNPNFVIKIETNDIIRIPYRPTVSSDGNLLIFCLNNLKASDYTIVLLNLKTKKMQNLVTDAYGPMKPIWINNHQFIYYSYSDKLFLFDVATLEKKDLQMPGYAPGAVTPSGKHILLSGNKKTVLYNIDTKKIDAILFNSSINTNGMLWLPDGLGFIYYRSAVADMRIMLLTCDDTGGIEYYSLVKKKSVRLIGRSSLNSSFVVPPDIELNPVDNEDNNRRLSFVASMPEQIGIRKICQLTK